MSPSAWSSNSRGRISATWDQLALSFASASNTSVTIFEVLSRTPVDPARASPTRAAAESRHQRRSDRSREPRRPLLRHRASDERGDEGTPRLPAHQDTQDVVLVSNSIEDSLGECRPRQASPGDLGAASHSLAALLLGYVGARLFARRIRRLEQAAERIASGKFDEPIVDSSPDELGQLARAFDRMRQRLAGLEHARREFIANASHELRTPLFSLGGHLELLVDEDLDEATKREFLERMREQVDRLTKLAGELLDLSRLDAGRLRVDREPVDLAQVVETLLEEFDARAQGTGHDLARGRRRRQRHRPRRRAADAPGRPCARRERDPPHAGRHSRARQREPERRPGRDRGRGRRAGNRSEPRRSHVFERFYRGDTGGRASGSGLGLAIAKRARGGDAGRDRALLRARSDRVHVLASCASSTSSPAIE